MKNMTSVDFIKTEEGFSKKMYKCTEGFNTIGYGFNLDSGITEKEAELILQERIYRNKLLLSAKYDWYDGLSNNRQIVIDSMIIQLGMNGFSKFKRTIKALENKDYDKVCIELEDSKAYRQTTNRWIRQIEIFRKG